MSKEYYEELKEKPTIAMLLDTEHLYGESQSRLGPLLITLCAGGAPILFYTYFAMWSWFPIWLFIPIEIFWIIRMIMKVQGREAYRKKIFKRQLYDEYTATDSLINIKTIHNDGCIEYMNGNITYLVVTFNGTTEDELTRSYEVRKLLQMLLGDYVFDIYIHNITVSPELRDYYNKAARFDRNASASNFIQIIDYTLKLTRNTSMIQCTIYAVKGRRGDWKDIQHALQVATQSKVAQVYKTIYVVSNPQEINDILNRDIDTVVNIQELLRKKYKTEDYASSRVLAYDLPDDKEIIQGQEAIEPVIPKQTKRQFHTTLKED